MGVTRIGKCGMDWAKRYDEDYRDHQRREKRNKRQIKRIAFIDFVPPVITQGRFHVLILTANLIVS